MKERYKVLAVMVLMSLGLWYGIERFMSGTGEYAAGLDIRAVSYMEPSDAPPPEPVDALANAPVEPPAPERDASLELTRIDVDIDDAIAADDASEDDADETADDETREAGEDEEAKEGVEEEGAGDAASEDAPERADSDADIEAQKAAEAEAARAAEAEQDRRIELPAPTDDAELVARLDAVDDDLLSDTPATRAVDLRLPFDTIAGCAVAAEAPLRTGIRFRHGSSAIKGESLNRIDAFLILRERCGGGPVVLEPNPQGSVDGDDDLAQRRRDEVRYYLLQRAVPRSLIDAEARR